MRYVQKISEDAGKNPGRAQALNFDKFTLYGSRLRPTQSEFLNQNSRFGFLKLLPKQDSNAV